MKKRALAVILTALSLTGCQTYHLTTESLLKQFAEVQKEKKVNVLLVAPFFFYPGIVDGNNLREITVLDKKEQEKTIRVSRGTSVKITQKDGKKTTFYFDTLLLKDSTITGNKTHFFTSHIKPVYFANISKIELNK